MKLPYSEGTVFLVPLIDGGFARGIVARSAPKGKVLMGYFFGPRLAAPDGFTWEGIEPERAILKVKFGDLGLIRGEWPIIGTLAGWDRSQWTIPDFIRRDPLGRLRPVLVRYRDDDPLSVEAEFPVEDDGRLQPASLSGSGAVEFKLTKLLRERSPDVS
jgi:hypothetical protein